MKHGKKYIEAAKQVDVDKRYAPKEAMGLVKNAEIAKFDESVEVHFNLGIDPKQADQIVRGTFTLPHGTGKTTRIVVITSGEKIKDAEEAGADEVGSEDIIEKISGGWLDFDIVIASPDMMGKVGKLGRLLGARGMMPSPKNGTVTPNVKDAVSQFKAGKMEYKNDKGGLIHLVIGKKSFEEKQLIENFNAIYDIIEKAKPAKAKGTYINSITLCSTMGPGVKVEPQNNKWETANND